MVGEPLLAGAGEGAEVTPVLDPIVDGQAVEGQLVGTRTAVRTVLAVESDPRPATRIQSTNIS